MPGEEELIGPFRYVGFNLVGRQRAREEEKRREERGSPRREIQREAKEMSPNLAGQFGDTTYTKVFVGGLAWETQKETMKKYFEQFGDILEAVVITDKNTGRSKGYGFVGLLYPLNLSSPPFSLFCLILCELRWVTFREAEAAMRACVDPSPVIDGRRANCNLASLGVQRSRPSTPQHGGSRSFRVMKSFQGGLQGGMATAFPSPVTFPHYAIQQGIPYNVYGYSPYSPDYTYPTAYYNVYGGGTAQYPLYGGTTACNGMATGTNAFYPYFQFGHGQTGYGLQYPQLFQYSNMSSTAGLTGFAGQQYGVTPLSLGLNTPAQVAGMALDF
ncbi:hypothetical protein HPP92_005357 [Vanilla planifolia]|uniref:RRM domain-containing protein n=1 Tax=Vanilla planifolia TaxID=51239 RepID=A0A835VEK5_VANPL|nr:hypothetical protein HPP92_005357 [Vanilla planifolia]